MTPKKFLKSLYDADKITLLSYRCGVSLLKEYVPLDCTKNNEAVALLIDALDDHLEEETSDKTGKDTWRPILDLIQRYYIIEDEDYDGPAAVARQRPDYTDDIEPVRDARNFFYHNAATTYYADQSALTWQPPPAKKPRAPKKPKVVVPVVTEPPRRRFA